MLRKNFNRKYALGPSLRSREGLGWVKNPLNLKHYPLTTEETPCKTEKLCEELIWPLNIFVENFQQP